MNKSLAVISWTESQWFTIGLMIWGIVGLVKWFTANARGSSGFFEFSLVSFGSLDADEEDKLGPEDEPVRIGQLGDDKKFGIMKGDDEDDDDEVPRVSSKTRPMDGGR